MSELYLMVSITDRRYAPKFGELYNRLGCQVAFVSLGKGTAASEILDSFGLEAAEKAILYSVVTGETWKKIKSGLQKEIGIDIPGTGVAFLIPLSSIGGKKQLAFMLSGQDFVKGEETTLKETKYELLIAVANQGYTEQIMDAARSAKAGGGTVVHAKGTGMKKAEKFLGFSLASEKEMVFIVVKTEDKNAIMRAIMDDAGISSKAQTIVFSLPVTATAGMRLLEETD